MTQVITADNILAIDPGLSNGIAVLSPERRLLLASEIETIGEKASKRLNMTNFADIIGQFRIGHVVIEDVSAMPKQGVTSMFRFGRAAGTFEGAISALRLPLTFVRPAQWKKDIGSKAKGDEDIRALAIQTWPDQAERFERKKDHNRAEAALIGLWFLRYSDFAQSKIFNDEVTE